MTTVSLPPTGVGTVDQSVLIATALDVAEKDEALPRPEKRTLAILEYC